jgi:hypothetical protein
VQRPQGACFVTYGRLGVSGSIGDQIAMPCRTTPSPPSITARPTRAEKERFAAIAASQGLSEGALALSAIRKIIATESDTQERRPTSPSDPSTDRITIRLRPGDHSAVARRASGRGMKSSTYLAALVRAHVACDPPLTNPELAALKQSAALLASLRGLLVQAHGTRLGAAPQLLEATRKAVSSLEQKVLALARAAIVSWETGSE